MAPPEPVQRRKLNSPSAKIDNRQAERVRCRKLPVARAVWDVEQVKGSGERELARIASAQRGFAVREQLLAAGFGRGAIVHRLKTGRLTERYRGVYLVDRRSIEPLGEETAAVLLFRGHGVLSHRTAAAMWELLADCPTEVTLTIVGKDARARPGLRLHRVPALERADLRAGHGLPLTAPARTLLDLAGEAMAAELEEAIAAAIQRRLLTPPDARAAMRRAPHRKGAARLARDRRRDQRFVAAGYVVLRVTWRQLIDEPYAVVTRLAQALTARAA